VIHYIGYTRDRKLKVRSRLPGKIDTNPRAHLSGRNSFSRGRLLAFHTPTAAKLAVSILTGLLQIERHNIVILVIIIDYYTPV